LEDGAHEGDGELKAAHLERHGELHEVAVREFPTAAAAPRVLVFWDDHSLLAQVDQPMLGNPQQLRDLRKG